MSNYQNKNEQGRSMVEMMGVLGLIGIITVASINFITAPNVHLSANNTLREVAMLAVNARKLLASNQPDITPIQSTTTLGFPISATHNTATDTFTIQLSNVPDTLCTLALENTTLQAISITSPTNCSSEHNTITFTFSGKLAAPTSPEMPDKPVAW